VVLIEVMIDLDVVLLALKTSGAGGRCCRRPPIVRRTQRWIPVFNPSQGTGRRAARAALKQALARGM
jgi:hypothetical protein